MLRLRCGRLRVVHLLALAAILCPLACDSSSGVPGTLLPLVRFVDTVNNASGRQTAPPVATLADESRPVLFVGWREHLLQTKVDAPESGAELTYAVLLGSELENANWVLVEPLVGVGWDWHPQPVLMLGPGEDKTRPITISVRLPELPEDKPVSVKIVGYAVPPLADRDTVTEAVVVPAGAQLRLAVGAEEPTWRAPPAPFELTVTALRAGRESVVYRRQLDPARTMTDRAWHEGRVDLSGLAGEEVRFRFSARATGSGIPSLPLWADPVILTRQQTRRPNVILISLDTLRALSVSSYGAERLTMPTLTERVARRGVLFEHAIAPFAYTLPSHVSMFTGLYHRTHGVRGMFHRIGMEHRTLAEALRDAGYATAAVTDDGYLWGVSGIRRGFSVYAERRPIETEAPVGPIADTFDRGLRWVGRHADQPFFLFLHTYQVHHPHRPKATYRKYFGDPASMSSDIERLRLRYEQEIRAADDALGTLLDELDRLGVAGHTLLVVTSDHGEEFMEHGERFHGKHVYDEVLRVPLLLRLPGVVPADRRVTTPVSLVDLTPTILDLLDLPPLAGVEGESLVPLFEQRARPLPGRVLYAEALSDFHAPSVDVMAARSATHKCILQRGEYECFDLVTDPGEHHPLPLDDSNRPVASLLQHIEKFRTAPAAPPSAEQGDEVDPTKVEQLRALGYVE